MTSTLYGIETAPSRPKCASKLCDRNTRQMDLLPPVDAAFKPADQSIIEASMEEPGPASRGRVPEELGLRALTEFFKNNMNLNHVSIEGIDPR